MRWDDIASVGFMAASIWLGTQTLNTSMNQWRDALEQEDLTWDEFRQEMLDAAGVSGTHHHVYEGVGEELWESSIKPVFLQRVGRRMIQELGTATLDEGEADRWLRAHQAWIQQTLRDIARETLAGEGGDEGGKGTGN